MKDVWISIIVPVYKVEKYLQKCIDSICSQTYSSLEIILVDDGSPDSCGVICDENARKDSRIKVVHKENKGLSSARNIGLEYATGEYVAFVDSDDIIHCRFIEILLDLCILYNCDIAQCDYLCVSEESEYLEINSEKLRFYTGKEALKELCCSKKSTGFTVAWNKLYKKELFKEIRYPVGRIHEDEFTTYLILNEANKVCVTNQYLYYYLRHSESITGRTYTLKRLDVLDAYKERLAFLSRHNLNEEYDYTLTTYLHLLKTHCREVEKLSNNETLLDSLKHEIKYLNTVQIESIVNISNELQVESVIGNCEITRTQRILLYGAGMRGQELYKKLRNGHYDVVGIVDNTWYSTEKKCFDVKPLDYVKRICFDIILIAIENKDVQRDVMDDLICWGIDVSKIRCL